MHRIAHNDPFTDNQLRVANFPLLRYLPNLSLLEPRVPPRQAPSKPILHQAPLDNLHLVDDRLGLLDGIVQRRQDGGNLALLWERRQR